MSNGYRNFIFAIVGWLILAGAALPPDERGTPEQSKPEQTLPQPPGPVAPPVEKSGQSPDLNTPCDQGEDNRNSDLCAQWKAADAAQESAVWTKRTFFLGVFGAVIGLLTLLYQRPLKLTHGIPFSSKS